ncbi:TolC family protein [uncultured Fusobacterium sp.]|uniref:TolC family protein n=1 Tax=uncultured Fusobacterium sp. TaxID=159267 RepID=UPI002803F5A4|nr:TolC family protein [uncultured Fusobacterium sp.]
MNLKKVMGLAAFLTLCTVSYSENNFSLDDVLERAKTSNRQVKAQQMSTEARREKKERAWKHLVLPAVNLSNEDDWDIVKEYGVGLEEFNVHIPIFTGGKNLNTYKKAKTQYEIAQRENNLVEMNAQEEAVATYFAVLNAKKQREITENTIGALEKQKERISDLYHNGKMVPKSELLKIEADIENNKGINLQNIHNENSYLGELAKLLSYPIDSKLDIEDFDPEKYIKDKATLESEARKSVEGTILGEREKLKLDSAAYDVKIAKADLYPIIYTKYTYNYREKNETTGRLDKVNDSEWGVGFRWVLSWGADLDNVKASQYEYERAKLEFEDNMQGISLEMKNKLSEIKALYGKTLSMKKRVDYLSENMEIDDMRYENDLLTTFDYLNSVNSFRLAQEQYYSLQRELVLSVIEYENLYK